MRARGMGLATLRLLPDPVRPYELTLHQLGPQQRLRRHLLTGKRPLRVRTQPVRRRNQQPKREPRTRRLRQETVDVRLRHRRRRRVMLCLDRPQLTLPCTGDQIDAGVRTPPIPPLVPQPDLLELCCVDRVVLKKPLAETLKLVPTLLGRSVQTVQ